MDKINIKTTRRSELVDITKEVQDVVKKSKIRDGVCFVTVPHTTAGVTINENADVSVESDISDFLGRLIPVNGGYSHAEGNSDAHIKSSLIGQSVTLFIEGGQLTLGTWQGIFFLEGDGPRSREAWVKILCAT